MSGFGEATAVKRIGDGRYEAVLDGDYGFAEALNGGYLMAVLGRAAVDASPHAHPVSTATNFHRVAKPGPAQVLVDPRKEGRTAASALVTLVQDDRAVVDALITTGTLDAAAEPAYAGLAPRPSRRWRSAPTSARPPARASPTRSTCASTGRRWAGSTGSRAAARDPRLVPARRRLPGRRLLPRPRRGRAAARRAEPRRAGLGADRRADLAHAGRPGARLARRARQRWLLAGGWFDEEVEVGHRKPPRRAEPPDSPRPRTRT